MMLKVLLQLCIVYAVTGKNAKDGDLPNSAPRLKWSLNYSVEATKYYMGSSLIENFKYWRFNSSSRLEANGGAVIKIVMGTKAEYEIHPETTEEETNKMVCVKNILWSVQPDDFLPSISELSEQGTEDVKGIECMKFTNEDEWDKSEERTLWAFYDNSTEVWIPVRYITKEMDEYHGYLKNYEIWDYFNFRQDISQGIFDITTYKCDNTQSSNKVAEINSRANQVFPSNTEEKKVLKDPFSTDTEIKKDGGLRREKTGKDGNIPFPYSHTQVKQVAGTLPKEYDLRLKGFVGPVINQHDCKSDWAFAVTAAVEGALARKNEGTWIKLSEQALIDCSWGYGNQGCASGHPDKSYQWIMKHGLPTEHDYGTYKNKNGFCKMENMTKTFKIFSYMKVTPFNVTALKIALITHGPIVVRVNRILSNIYDEGVFYDSACTNSPKQLSDHMTLVGYGEKDGETFWILKNSKGPYSGISGYIHISTRDNNCGVMTEPTYVV